MPRTCATYVLLASNMGIECRPAQLVLRDDRRILLSRQRPRIIVAHHRNRSRPRVINNNALQQPVLSCPRDALVDHEEIKQLLHFV
jgi:hypothetical protein